MPQSHLPCADPATLDWCEPCQGVARMVELCLSACPALEACRDYAADPRLWRPATIEARKHGRAVVLAGGLYEGRHHPVAQTSGGRRRQVGSRARA